MSSLESDNNLVKRYSTGFRAFMILFWSSLAIYFAIELPKVWFDDNYSRIGLSIVIIPVGLITILGLLFPFLEKVIITNDFIEAKNILSKRIYFKDLVNVDLGPNFIKLYSNKKKTVLVSWLYEDYDEIKYLLLEKVNSLPEVRITQRKRYRN